MAQAKGWRDGTSSSNENARPAWQGPRTLLLQKNSQGFGFTLRHFIVYPPESVLHTGPTDEENGNGKGCQKSRLEPMDTIFVKNVKEKGPAHHAGLCKGDRLVKVNGESVLGKTYSQVIALIQNSDSVLELSIMPKDEDVLQLAYSEDAYLKGNEPYTGGAQNLPEPPPICYPRVKPAASPLAAPHAPHGYEQLDNLNCLPLGASGQGLPLDNRSARDEVGLQRPPPGQRPPLGQHRARSSSSVGIGASPLDFHFANHNAAIASASLPHPRKGSLPLARSELCHRALSDWYYSQAGERPGAPVSPRHRSISQDRLAELGQALARGPAGGWPHSASHDTLLHLHYGPGGGAGGAGGAFAAYGDRPGGWAVGQPSGRSGSENLLAAYAAYERTYDRSLETLEQAAALVSPRYERPAWPGQPIRAEERQNPANHRAGLVGAGAGQTGRGPAQTQKQQAGSQPRRLPAQTTDDQTVGYRSYSPSFCRKAGHLMQQSHSFKDPSYMGPHLNWTPKPCPPESVPPPAALTPTSSADSQDGLRRAGEEPVQAHTQEVVLRQKPPQGRRPPHALASRHPQYALAVDTTEPPPAAIALATGTPAKPNGNLPAQHVEKDSLASIPFIDEPTSPGADLRARHVPASSVVSGGPCPAAALTATSPSSLTSPLTHLLYADCRSKVNLRHPAKFWQITLMAGSIKNSRRSSYLLAITTERSKSCDEGLNTFRDEGRVFSRLPKRVKSFFTEGSLESLRVTEDARSKRHSTSELGSITVSDVRKEGWLHYRQILTDKGKKVGGGIRPWRRVFSVLRSQSLFLYKDKREAVLHGAGVGGHAHGNGQGEEEQPIDIRGCLIDIAYSETKRKHALRLTTQDFCEYLLQAEGREDMLGWIRVIRENSKTDNEELGFSRQALINKKMNDYRKQSPTGSKPDTSPRVHRMMPPFLLSKTENTSGINRTPKAESKDESAPSKVPWGINIMKKGKKPGPKAFGVRLEDCPPGANNKFVPLIVEICCGVVEQLGLEYTGIYRVPGNNAMVSTLQDQLNKGMEINTAEEKWQDLNVISSLLKSFFRKLPEPLFTDDKYNDFIDANRLEDAGDRLKTMKKLIRDLPDHYYHTLKFLVGHLKNVADNSEKNKMEPRNLALVFGPTLVRTSEDNMTDMVTHMPDRYKIVETLISHHTWFFSNDLDKDEKTPEEQQDVQPAPNIDHLLSNIGRTMPRADGTDSTNSDSAKSKGSSSSKKDLSAKDFIPLSFISAVTRKRKKRQSVRLQGSSSDEDSEHEPVKATNYGETGEAGGEEGGAGRAPPPSEREAHDEKDVRRAEVGPCEGEGEEEEEEEESTGSGQEKGRGALDVCARAAAWQSSDTSMLSRAADKAESGVGVTEGGSSPRSVLRRGQPRVYPQRPRSFLYTHHPVQLGAGDLSGPGPSPSPPGGARGEHHLPITSTPTTSSPQTPSTASQIPQRPGQCEPLPRRRPRADRVRPHSLYVEWSHGSEEQGLGPRPAGVRSAAQAVPRTKGSFPNRCQETPACQALSPGWGSGRRGLERPWVGTLGSADDLRRPEGPWRRSSPETQRRRRDWRRHTVALSLSGKG